VTCVTVDKQGTALAVPSGFTAIGTLYVGPSVTGGMAYKISDGTETTITWTWTTTDRLSVGIAAVYSGMAVSPFDVMAQADSADVAVTSQSTGTTGTLAQSDEMAIAIVGGDTAANISTSRAWTNNFVEQQWLSPSSTSGNGIPGLGYAEKSLNSTSGVESTFSTTGVGDQTYGVVATFKIAPSTFILYSTTSPLRW
jgi:hypothetical protein